MKLRYASLFAQATLLGSAFAFPPTMDIGAFAIDNYAGNGGGAINLSFQVASGQNFFWAANSILPGYSSSVGGGAGTSGPSLALDKRNTAVTEAAITSTSSAYGNREYCDFGFFGGHGFAPGFFLGLNPGYLDVNPNELNLGLGYNRWFMANACIIFKTTPTPPATAWAPAFKGLKALLGFRSVVFDNNISWDLYYDFWYNWTWREKGLAYAYFDAQANYGYKHFYPSAGLEPGCISAQVPGGTTNHCQEIFKNVAHDYTSATQNSGYYYSRVIGSPHY